MMDLRASLTMPWRQSSLEQQVEAKRKSPKLGGRMMKLPHHDGNCHFLYKSRKATFHQQVMLHMHKASKLGGRMMSIMMAMHGHFSTLYKSRNQEQQQLLTKAPRRLSVVAGHGSCSPNIPSIARDAPFTAQISSVLPSSTSQNEQGQH